MLDHLSMFLKMGSAGSGPVEAQVGSVSLGYVWAVYFLVTTLTDVGHAFFGSCRRIMDFVFGVRLSSLCGKGVSVSALRRELASRRHTHTFELLAHGLLRRLKWPFAKDPRASLVSTTKGAVI